jgi:uncharacterized membrane protein YhhN
MIAWIALGAAALCALLRCTLGNYIFSACTTLLCACAAALSAAGASKWAIAAGLLVSIAGDWFLAHQRPGAGRFLYGVILFLIAHCLFSVSAAMRFKFSAGALAAAAVLAVCYGLYMYLRILPRVDSGLKLPLVMYMLVSVISLWFAMSMAGPGYVRLVYTVGIAAIVFSDTMIAENIYMGSALAGRLVHPTYYLCHVLVALSALLT